MQIVKRRITTPAVERQLRQDAKPFDKPAHRPIKALAGLSREVLPVRGFFKGTRMKKLLNAAGCKQVTLAPKPLRKNEVITFDTPPVTRVCNASSKEPYVTPAWPSARVSAADGIKSRGWM